MNSITGVLKHVPQGWDEGLSWLAGLAVTLALFLGMAHFENTGAPAPEIEDLRIVSLPVDAPPLPPPPVETEPEPMEMTPLVGIDAGTSDSNVHLRALPPDFAELMADAPRPAKRLDTLGRIQSDLKPRAQTDVDVHRVYQQFEVDRVPRAIVRTTPSVQREHFDGASTRRVVLLLTIDQRGRVENARISIPSGAAAFDQLVARTVRESWEFTPAIRRGKPVRCLAEQPIRIELPGGSPFSLQ